MRLSVLLVFEVDELTAFKEQGRRRSYELTVESTRRIT